MTTELLIVGQLEAQKERVKLARIALINYRDKHGMCGDPTLRANRKPSFEADIDAMSALKDYFREYTKLAYMRHGEALKAAARARNKDYPYNASEIRRRWRESHPGYSIAPAAKEAAHRRRAKLANSEGSFSWDEFKLLCIKFDNCCAYCGSLEPLVPDHVVPLSRGGTNTIGNILPACSYCNGSKKDKLLEEWLDV